ncbi:MAG TPA: bifunctional nuclease family protein [archaeon]|nr:bifunctional nuclease family protein [archaeon]
MKSKKKEKIPGYKKTILIAAMIMIAVSASYISLKDLLLPKLASVPEMSTEGYTEVAIDINVTEDRGIVSLSGNCYEILATVDKAQAISIEKGIMGVIEQRPNTHDLIKDMLKSLDVKMLMMKINDLRNGTYFSKIILQKGNLILSLDSRPSDALAIAARTEYEVPIYIKNELLEAGFKIC